jgi:acylphosphatase
VYSLRLTDVDGSLTTLSTHRGFRNFVKAKADEIGVTGTIQRYLHSDAIIEFEGTDQRVGEMWVFLRLCHGQGMFQNFGISSERVSNCSRYEDFSILADFTLEREGKIAKGLYSDGQSEKLSEYSIDSWTDYHW